ncbi:DsbA family protein [Pantoea allii]|uniref:DsbA family protein n=1 Tax=Pantoea allii TaxID=574096 RepID=UPI000A239AC6|nr:DsbA family protein [Pantoea allii]MBW1251373.1 DsbA family protein [Pantoea allii]MBW1261158.1 DsbA family protein [Pantoea allii]MBW1282567.1 DsbA family protein [Pantoea allii]MDJ0088472.1 DsbA family protein [Pantoea allii]ORM82966.1 thiol:disulfide interchange protein [Pantoea allii]
MKKRISYVLAYTVFVAVISAVITTAWFHIFVLNQTSSAEQQVLTSLSTEKLDKSPIADGDDIIEIFSYGCHYCEINEKNVDELEKRMPPGKKLVRLHLSLDSQAGLARYAPVFATLEVMGIEEAHRQSAYDAVMKDKIDLSDATQRDAWLEKNKINVAEYHKVSQSADVKARLDYMTRVSQYYDINATPTFIVAKKWMAIQDRDFPAFSDKLLSILETGKAPE